MATDRLLIQGGDGPAMGSGPIDSIASEGMGGRCFERALLCFIILFSIAATAITCARPERGVLPGGLPAIKTATTVTAVEDPQIATTSATTQVSATQVLTRTLATIAQTSVRSTPSKTPAAADDWELAFSDEFEGPTLDRSKWTPSFWWGNLRAEELQAYSPNNVELADGVLRLRADNAPSDGRRFTSGMVSSHRSFSQQFGRFEMRARVPAGNGLWPAFWLALDAREGVTWPPEIDVMELIGGAPRVLHLAQHFINENGDVDLRQNALTTVDLSKDYHVYGVEWNPDVTAWYLDGSPVWRSPTRAKGRMYLVVNLAIGDWAGNPDGTTPFPSYFIVDYVRAFRRAT